MSELTIVPLDTEALGDRSYVISDGRVAVVVDPQRDIDRVIGIVTDLGVVVAAVLETHIHNDYVTGGLELSRVTGAVYVVSAAESVAYERHPVTDGEVMTFGDIQVTAVHTPGHTPHHMSYVVSHEGRVRAVFSGGSMLYGATGRPDLLGPALTVGLAHDQWHSVRRLAAVLPDEAEVMPTHGFGSFCSTNQQECSTAGMAATVGEQRLVNPALTRDEETFVSEMLAGLDAFPAYYAHMGPTNAAGPTRVDLSPAERADAAEIRRRIDAGEWVIDLRSRSAFARGHVAGSLGFDLSGPMVTYLGWLLPHGTPVTLLGESPEQVAQAQRELVRIGIDRPAAAATGSVEQWSGGDPLASLQVARWSDVARLGLLDADGPVSDGRVVLLDVRQHRERARSAVVGSMHIPVHELPSRLDEVPEGDVWVHCASGYRASVVAGLLSRSGRRVTVVDDSFDRAAGCGLPVQPCEECLPDLVLSGA